MANVQLVVYINKIPHLNLPERLHRDDSVAEEFDSIAKEIDLVLVHLNFTTTTELGSAEAVLIRRPVHVTYNMKYIYIGLQTLSHDPD
jgi:hypothetical protein